MMVEGSDIYGDGVNIAARLEGIAEPGGILISGTAYDYIKNKVDVGFDDLGTQTLKNIAEPVRVYRVDGMPRVSVGTAKPATDKPSIAVLPFTNMSGDAGAAILQRWHHRRYHHRVVAVPLAVRHRPKLIVPVP